MTRQIINLGDNLWRFGQIPRNSYSAPNIFDQPNVTEWLPATVPGNVRTDLLTLGRIPDPFFDRDYEASLWVEDVDWWYRRTIRLDRLLPGHRAFLIFEGVDYLSAVFINEQELARHEGMFSRQTVDITAALRAGATEIAVRLWGSGALPRRKLTWRQTAWQKIASLLHRSWVGIYPDRSATLKCQMSFGWDFAPPIRTMGIWDEVHLVICGPVFIAETRVVGRPVSLESAVEPNLSSRSKAPAHLAISLTLDSDGPHQVMVSVEANPANFHGPSFGPFQFPLTLPAGQSTHRLSVRLAAAAVWQPWDRGQPHLYDIKISLAGSKGETLDKVVVRTGIRSVELQDWQIRLNGPREFIRGLNWVPADSFPGRLRTEHYAHLLQLARQSGANLLRVWGGGLREKRAFYNLCDEMGFLVWQEFPFACMFLGTYPRDPAYLKLVQAECRAIVRQLSHHPSIIVWCGGNEYSPTRNRHLVDTLATIVRENDGTRPFLPVSPSLARNGDAHNWLVWHGDAPVQAYQNETACFLSEFGLQALPHFDTLKIALPNPATGWETHHGDGHKLKRYAAPFAVTAAEDAPTTLDNLPGEVHPPAAQPLPAYPPGQVFSSLQSLIAASQQAQAAAVQTAIEHMRRRKAKAGGVCLWQFNEPWPAISWAIVDYFGRPKLAYEQLATWFKPVLISLNFPVGRRWPAGEIFTAEIWVINDTLRAYGGCDLQLFLDGTLAYRQQIDLKPDTSQLLGLLNQPLTSPLGEIRVTLRHEAGILAQNNYNLAWSDPRPGSAGQRLRRWVADWVLR